MFDGGQVQWVSAKTEYSNRTIRHACIVNSSCKHTFACNTQCLICNSYIRSRIGIPYFVPCANEVQSGTGVEVHGIRTVITKDIIMITYDLQTLKYCHQLRVSGVYCSGLRFFKKVTYICWQVVGICKEHEIGKMSHVCVI